MSLNSDPCMIRPTLIDLNSFDLNYYPFMVNLDKSAGSCNSVDDLSIKTCVPSKIKDTNVNVFNMITNINEAKTIVKHILCDCKSSTTFNSNKKWNNDRCQSECKKYHKCRKDYSWNPNRCICKDGKYLKRIADTSVIVCDEFKYVTDIVSTNVANTIPANAISTLSINCHNKKVRYKIGYILLVLLLITALFISMFTCHYHTNRSKQKHIDKLTI